MAKKLINTEVKLGTGTLLKEAISEHLDIGERVELWSGSWSSGTITLNDDITNYNYCIVVWESAGTYGIVPILTKDLTHNPSSDTGYFRGGGTLNNGTYEYIYSISATFDYTVKPTKLTLSYSGYLRHNASSNHQAMVATTPVRIVGAKGIGSGGGGGGGDFTDIGGYYEINKR